MKIVNAISRYIIGLLFIFSGFVKAVDPIGGAIKFTDYFQALHLSALTPIAIHLAILLATLEFLIGIHLIFNIRRELTSWMTLIFMSFFTILTLYSAIFNPVTDCGCFGDAIKLSNWQTFFKNVLFFIPTIILFAYRKNNDTNLSEPRKWAITSYFAITILAVSFYGMAHLPLLDFRPFKVGNNITDGMTIPPGAEQPVFESTFILQKNGQTEEFSLENYPFKDSSWVYVETKTKTIKEGYQPPIHDFTLATSGGETRTEQILDSPKPTFLLVSHKIDQANYRSVNKMMELQAQCRELGYPFFLVTSSPDQDIQDFEIKTNAAFDVLKADDTMLKTFTRANLGLVLLQNGTILGKWNANFTPSVAEFKNPVGAALHFQTNSRNIAYLLVILFLSTTFALGIFLKRK